MTIDYKALAERVKAIADGYEASAVADGLREEIADLRTVVSLLEGMADAKPEAWLYRDWANVLKVSQLNPHEENAFPVYTRPQPEHQPVSEPTEAQIEAGARVLCHRFAELCNVNEQDTWNAHCDEFRDDAAEALRAALAAKDK